VTAVAGPFLAIAALLAAGGVLKVARPATTAKALETMGLPSSPSLVRVGAAVEATVAAAAVVWAAPALAAAVAMSYAGFAGFVLAALRRGVPLSSCGCFGVDDTPPTYGHVALNLVAAAVATTVALGSSRAGLVDLGRLEGSVLLRCVFLVVTAACAWLAYVALTLLPQVLGRRSPAVAR